MIMGNMILGQNVVYSMDCNKTGLNNNVLVVGGSGSGKTKSVSEPMLLENKSYSQVVTVTKRRIVNQYKNLFRERGFVVHDLNFARPERADVSYDPLYYIRSQQDIVHLAEAVAMMGCEAEGDNAYWHHSAVSLHMAEIACVLMTVDHPTYADVLKLHRKIRIIGRGEQVATNVDQMFWELEEKNPGCLAVTAWKTFHQLPVRTASCVYSTLNTALDSVFTPELQEQIASKPTVDFRSMATRKTILFVTSSAVNPTMHCLVNMFYAQMFKNLFEYAEDRADGRLPIPVQVLCDDFATGSRILNFPEYISVFREKQISVILLVQSESQLESIYGPMDATTIINNCDTYLYLGGMDLKTGHSISQRLNIPLDEVLYMPIGQEFVFRRGQRPNVTTRYDILNDPRYQSIEQEFICSTGGFELFL